MQRLPHVDTPTRTLSVRAAAKALGIGRTKLYEMLNEGRLRSFLLGRRRLILQEDLNSLIYSAMDEQQP